MKHLDSYSIYKYCTEYFRSIISVQRNISKDIRESVGSVMVKNASELITNFRILIQDKQPNTLSPRILSFLYSIEENISLIEIMFETKHVSKRFHRRIAELLTHMLEDTEKWYNSVNKNIKNQTL